MSFPRPLPLLLCDVCTGVKLHDAKLEVFQEVLRAVPFDLSGQSAHKSTLAAFIHAMYRSRHDSSRV